jgi:hypothetical protein
MITLPADLLHEGENIGSIIKVSSDDIRVGFQEANNSGKKFALILIELEPGQTLRINRSTEAIVRSPSSAPIHFDIA